MEKKPVLRAIGLEEAIADLMDAEKIVAELESTDVLGRSLRVSIHTIMRRGFCCVNC